MNPSLNTTLFATLLLFSIIAISITISGQSSGFSFGHYAEDVAGGTFGKNISSTQNYYFTGKVGIGTTAPGEKLEVSGNIKLSGAYGSIFKSGTYPFKTYWYYEDDGTGYGPAWIHKNTASGNTYPTLFLKTHGDGAILTADYALELGDMTVTLGSYPSITTRTRISGGSGENSYFNTGGNIGIGTTAPGAKLAVIGDLAVGANTVDNAQRWSRVLTVQGGPCAKLLVTETTAGVKTGIFSHSAWGGTVGRIGTESSHDLRLMAGYGNDVVSITTAGNVGIGTTEPQSKLDVAGFIRQQCPSGWWSAAYGRVCMESTLRGPNNMWDAIGICKSVGNGARVCEHNDFQQICGANPGLNPYGAASGWYGDHGDNENEGTPYGDDDYLTWNLNGCSNNNDGPSRAASAVSLNFRCCI